jgi:hypothetical protein
MTYSFDLLKHLTRAIDFSNRVFGPGKRTKGIIDHITKELKEIEAKPDDLEEWIDVVILGLDGAWRAGYTPGQICRALEAKQAKNEARKWPDWRTSRQDRAIEHIRTELSPQSAIENLDALDEILKDANDTRSEVAP